MPTTTAPMTATTSIQTQTTGFTTTAIPVTKHKLAIGQFPEAPCPTVRSSVQNPPPLEDIPKAPVSQGTPWPNARSTSENLFETRKDLPIPPTPAPTSAPTMKTEAPPQVAAIPREMATPRQAAKNCTWGIHCPICQEQREHEEGWDGNLQNTQRMQPPKHTITPTTELPVSSAPVPPATKCSAEYPVPPAPKPSMPQPQPQDNQQSFDIPNR